MPITLQLSRKLTDAEKAGLTTAKERLAAECEKVASRASKLRKLSATLAELEAEHAAQQVKAQTGTDRKASAEILAIAQQKEALLGTIEDARLAMSDRREPIYQAVNDARQLVASVAARDLAEQLDALATDAFAPFFTDRARCLQPVLGMDARRALGGFFNAPIASDPLALVDNAATTGKTIEALLAGAPLFTFAGAAGK